MICEWLDCTPYDAAPLSDLSDASLSSTKTSPIRQYRPRKTQCVFRVKPKRTELTENEKHWWIRKKPGYFSVGQATLGETGTPSSSEDSGGKLLLKTRKSINVTPIQRYTLKLGSKKEHEHQSKVNGSVTAAGPSSKFTENNIKCHQLENWDCETPVSTPSSQAITKGALKAQPWRSSCASPHSPSNRSTQLYRTFMSGTPPDSSESETSEISERQNINDKSSKSVRAPRRSNKSRAEFTLAEPEVTMFLPEVWDWSILQPWAYPNLTCTPPDSSDDEENDHSSSVSKQEAASLVSIKIPTKFFEKNTGVINRGDSQTRINRDTANRFSKRIGRERRKGPREPRPKRRKQRKPIILCFKNRRKPKKPHSVNSTCKAKPKETLKKTESYITEERPEETWRKLKKTYTNGFIPKARVKKTLKGIKESESIFKAPSDGLMQETKAGGKQGRKKRKKNRKKRKKWPNKSQQPKKKND